LNTENASARERLNATLERFHTAMADLRTETARRETRLILTMAGMIGLTVAILGLWLG